MRHFCPISPADLPEKEELLAQPLHASKTKVLGETPVVAPSIVHIKVPDVVASPAALALASC